ncbi:MAG: carboxypeptidase-like regulatory domain-containing protein [Treponema sp.]
MKHLFAIALMLPFFAAGNAVFADEAKNPIGITVIVKNVETQRTYTLVSNADGKITTTALPAGKYVISEVKTEMDSGSFSWQ